jgi:hypothetical protein
MVRKKVYQRLLSVPGEPAAFGSHQKTDWSAIPKRGGLTKIMLYIAGKNKNWFINGQLQFEGKLDGMLPGQVPGALSGLSFLDLNSFAQNCVPHYNSINSPHFTFNKSNHPKLIFEAHNLLTGSISCSSC